MNEESPVPPRVPQGLLERTALFAEAIIRLSKQAPRGLIPNRLIDRLVRAGSSIAANYGEADDSVSGKDFGLRASDFAPR